jgi:peptide/nickel transport system ATP-binding protein
MYLGKLCETAAVETLYRSPRHPYTASLLASQPEPDPDQISLKADLQAVEIPSPVSPPSSYRFQTRCPAAQQVCVDTEPDLMEVVPGRQVACHFPL